MTTYAINPLSSSYIAASDANTDLLQTWFALFTASTYWQVDVALGTNGDGGMVVSPIGGGAQVNFRVDGANLQMSMDYDGQITDPSDPSASAGDWSGELLWIASELNNTGSFHEWPDQVVILNRNGLVFQYSLIAGKVINPRYGLDSSVGRDGTGFAVGDPDFGNTVSWFGTSSGSTRNLYHWANGVWSSVRPNSLSTPGAFANIDLPSGERQPIPIQMNPGGGGFTPNIGTLRYCFLWRTLTTGAPVRDSGNTQDYALVSAGGTGNLLMPVQFGFNVLT